MERMNNHGPNFQDDMTKKWSWGFDEKVLKNDFRFLRRRDWSILGKKIGFDWKSDFQRFWGAQIYHFSILVTLCRGGRVTLFKSIPDIGYETN